MRKLLIVLLVMTMLLPAASPALADTVYIVQRGDTLFGIATRFGVSLQALAAANGINNVNLIFVGEQLTIPSAGGGSTTPPPPPTSGGGTYTVQRGDYLSAIALRFGVSLADLINANNLANPNLLFVGQVLSSRAAVRPTHRRTILRPHRLRPQAAPIRCKVATPCGPSRSASAFR
jgi:LysM repeat protein